MRREGYYLWNWPLRANSMTLPFQQKQDLAFNDHCLYTQSRKENAKSTKMVVMNLADSAFQHNGLREKIFMLLPRLCLIR